MITITILNKQHKQLLEVPTDINLSLMEVLRAYGFNHMGTCGGMALCASCHVKIVHSKHPLKELSVEEINMLDTLPDGDENSRLSCQIRVDESLDGLQIAID